MTTHTEAHNHGDQPCDPSEEAAIRGWEAEAALVVALRTTRLMYRQSRGEGLYRHEDGTWHATPADDWAARTVRGALQASGWRLTRQGLREALDNFDRLHVLAGHSPDCSVCASLRANLASDPLP